MVLCIIISISLFSRYPCIVVIMQIHALTAILININRTLCQGKILKKIKKELNVQNIISDKLDTWHCCSYYGQQIGKTVYFRPSPWTNYLFVNFRQCNSQVFKGGGSFDQMWLTTKISLALMAVGLSEILEKINKFCLICIWQ